MLMFSARIVMFYKQLIQQRLWEKHEHIAWDLNIQLQELPSWILLLSISQWPTFKRIADFIGKPTFWFFIPWSEMAEFSSSSFSSCPLTTSSVEVALFSDFCWPFNAWILEVKHEPEMLVGRWDDVFQPCIEVSIQPENMIRSCICINRYQIPFYKQTRENSTHTLNITHDLAKNKLYIIWSSYDMSVFSNQNHPSMYYCLFPISLDILRPYVCNLMLLMAPLEPSPCRKVLKDAMEQKAQEAAEHTFKPHINQRSKEIFRLGWLKMVEGLGNKMVALWFFGWLVGWLVVSTSGACVFLFFGRGGWKSALFVWIFSPENLGGEMMQLQFDVYCLFIFALK